MLYFIVYKQAILNRVDHTLLTTTATWEQVKTLCGPAAVRLLRIS